MNRALVSGASAAAVMGLTAAHHGYGAVRFDTPWRHHVVHFSIWVVAAIAVAVGVHLRARRPEIRWAGMLGAGALILLAPVGWIGIFEGGYNHVLKNLLYFAGVAPETFGRLFPPPRYQPPTDWLFELTGVLQFPLGLFAGSRLARWWRGRGSLSRIPLRR